MVLCVGYLGGTELCVWIEYHLGVGGGVFLYGALCGIFGWGGVFLYGALCGIFGWN